MANSPTKTLRVKPGSALERLTAGAEDFTAKMHHIAECFELALVEENRRAQQQLIRETEQATAQAIFDRITEPFEPKVPGLPAVYVAEIVTRGGVPPDIETQRLTFGEETANLAAYVAELKACDGYESPRLRELAQALTADQMLALAREQSPGNLVPVVDDNDAEFGVLQGEGEETTVVQAGVQAQNEADEDLSDLA